MKFALGVDEAGRGPLAGPVAVGAVMVPEGFDVAVEFPGVRDSKKLSEGKRETLFAALETRAARGDVLFVVEFESAETIDASGIGRSVRDAVWRGVRALSPEPENARIFLDGLLAAPPEYAQETIVHGDDLIPLISLASIAAKVTRDRLMVRLAETYPEYGFEKHKGYGTAAHYAALRKHGPCELHRKTFLHAARN